MTKRHKPKRKRGPHTITASSGSGSVTYEAPFRPVRPRKEPPTELELSAKRIGRLLNDIAVCRMRIGQIEQDISNERATLANLMLEHQAETAKSKDLALIPQPLP